MKQYFVYILLCNDNSYYTGITNDLERRMFEHENGTDPASYISKRRPVKLVFYENFPDPVQAISFEKQVKGWSRAKKAAIINGNWDLLPELSRNNIGKKHGE
jgi:putative endonuclease